MYLIVTFGTQVVGFKLQGYQDVGPVLAPLDRAELLGWHYEPDSDVRFRRDATSKIEIEFVDDAKIADAPKETDKLVPEAALAVDPLDSL